MRKVFVVLFLALAMAVMVLPAVAEGIGAGGLPVEPFSWDYLATIAGATAATLLIVQLLKLPLDRVWKIPTRLLVYFIALIILILATAFTTGLDWNTGILTAVNAIIVALAAMGSYELTFAKADHPD